MQLERPSKHKSFGFIYFTICNYQGALEISENFYYVQYTYDQSREIWRDKVQSKQDM